MFYRDCPFCVGFSQNYLNTDSIAMGFLLAQLHFTMSRAKIYLKREDLNHTGSHKINNSIGQALLTKFVGKKQVIAETRRRSAWRGDCNSSSFGKVFLWALRMLSVRL